MMTIFASLIVILPVAYLLGVPILGIIYNIELSAYRWLLLGVIIGAAFYASSNVLLNALITLRCTKVQLILQVGMLALSIGVSILFIGSMELTGSILSYIQYYSSVYQLFSIICNCVGKNFQGRDI